MFKSRGDSNIVYKCTVRLLEDTEILECEFHPGYKGKYLLEHVCQQLNLAETDYFGLRYVDSAGQRHWLHIAKLILKQVKDSAPILFSFRVKFYPPNPLLLKEDVTRFQIYLQLKRDLLHGRLYCTANEAAMLGALIIQIELGDYDPSIHVGNYVTEMRLLLRQTDAIEARIQELHREPVEGTACGAGGVKGLSTQEAERTFLKIACQLDTYGVDPHPVKDHRGNQLYVGINHGGILAFQGGRKTNHFKWSEVNKINFEGRMFIVHLNYPEKKHTVGFKCPSGAACRHVWCCAIEQMLFFTLPSSSDACVYSGGGLFSWGTKFKYVGRTEREILERDGLLPPRDHSEEGSSGGGRRKASSVPATPSTPMTGDFGYSSLPRSTSRSPAATRPPLPVPNTAGMPTSTRRLSLRLRTARTVRTVRTCPACRGRKRNGEPRYSRPRAPSACCAPSYPPSCSCGCRWRSPRCCSSRRTGRCCNNSNVSQRSSPLGITTTHLLRST